MNTDGGPGVGLAEFKDWWLLDAAKRHGDRKRRPPLSLSCESLMENIVRLSSALQRDGYSDLVSSIKQCTSSEDFRQQVKPGKDLKLALLKGNVREAAEHVSWLLHQREYKEAIFVLIDIINWNMDSVDIPPATLPKPEELSGEAFFLGLALYLEQFASLLKYEGHKNRAQHCNYFFKFASELRHKPTLRLLAEAYDVQGISKRETISSKMQYEKFAIVREMIGLKYGPDQPVNHAMIVEAEKSLSTWMAGNRRNVQEAATSVKDLTSDYFTSYVPTDAKEPVISIPVNTEIKGIVEKSRRLAADHEGQSVLNKLGPEAVAYEEARKANEKEQRLRDGQASEEDDEPLKESEKNPEAGRALKKVQSKLRPSVDAEVDLLMQAAGGANSFESSFGNIQSLLHRHRAPSPMARYECQPSISISKESSFSEGLSPGPPCGRSASSLAFSPPHHPAQPSRPLPSFSRPPLSSSVLGPPPPLSLQSKCFHTRLNS